jgi:sulfoxide reductase heme-binding subunit YedZ
MVDFILSNLGVLLVVPFYFLIHYLRKSIHQHPFYYEIGALVLAILIIIHNQLGLNFGVINVLFNSGQIALSLFLLVIFTGAFKKTSKIRKTLELARGEIAVIAFILLLPHGLKNSSLALSGYNSTGLIANILMIPLVLTTFMFIRKRMKPRDWKNLHKLSYIAYLMIYIHIAFDINLNPANPFFRFSSYAVLYHLMLILYLVLRYYSKHSKTNLKVSKS